MIYVKGSTNVFGQDRNPGTASDTNSISVLTPKPQAARRNTLVRPIGVVPGIKTSDTHEQVMIRLGSNEPDADQILRVIDNLGHLFANQQVIRDVALRIVGDTGDNGVDVQLDRIVQFVKQNVRYVRDPAGSEYVISPLRLLIDISTYGYASGDCDDHVLLLNSLLGSLGFDIRPIGVHLYDDSVFDHVISNVLVRGTWIDIDPCAKEVVMPEYGDRLIVQG